METLMPLEPVEHPIRGPKAFEHTGDAAVMSQAAILLLLGTIRRGDDRALRARAAAVGAPRAVVRSPATGGVSLPMPRVPATGDRLPDEVAPPRLAPRHPRIAEMAPLEPEIRPRSGPGPAGPATRLAPKGKRRKGPRPRTAAEAAAAPALLVHGTFAHDSAWYQPGGDFQ